MSNEVLQEALRLSSQRSVEAGYLEGLLIGLIITVENGSPSLPEVVARVKDLMTEKVGTKW